MSADKTYPVKIQWGGQIVTVPMHCYGVTGPAIFIMGAGGTRDAARLFENPEIAGKFRVFETQAPFAADLSSKLDIKTFPNLFSYADFYLRLLVGISEQYGIEIKIVHAPSNFGYIGTLMVELLNQGKHPSYKAKLKAVVLDGAPISWEDLDLGSVSQHYDHNFNLHRVVGMLGGAPRLLSDVGEQKHADEQVNLYDRHIEEESTVQKMKAQGHGPTVIESVALTPSRASMFWERHKNRWLHSGEPVYVELVAHFLTQIFSAVSSKAPSTEDYLNKFGAHREGPEFLIVSGLRDGKIRPPLDCFLNRKLLKEKNLREVKIPKRCTLHYFPDANHDATEGAEYPQVFQDWLKTKAMPLDIVPVPRKVSDVRVVFFVDSFANRRVLLNYLHRCGGSRLFSVTSALPCLFSNTVPSTSSSVLQEEQRTKSEKKVRIDELSEPQFGGEKEQVVSPSSAIVCLPGAQRI